jgi:hypothetical protein
MALHTLATEAGQRHAAARRVQAFVTGNAARREYLAVKVCAFIRFMFASSYMHHSIKTFPSGCVALQVAACKIQASLRGMQLRRQLDAAETAARAQLRNTRGALRASADVTSALEPLPHARVFVAAAEAHALPTEAERVLHQLQEAEQALSRAIDVTEARLVPGGSLIFMSPAWFIVYGGSLIKYSGCVCVCGGGGRHENNPIAGR